MKVIGNHILVQFEPVNTFKIGDLVLERPVGVYEFDEPTQERRFLTDGNNNRLEVNPQIATIVASSDKFKVKKGDRVLLHYMAWEWCKENNPLDIEGIECYQTDGGFILGLIKDDKLIPIDNTYFGKRVFLDAPKTESGLYLTPYDTIKQASHIEITHLPVSTEREYEHLSVGQIAISVDDKQYPFFLDEQEYIWLKTSEIVAWADRSVYN